MKTSERLRLLREEANLTQAALGKHLHISQRSYSHYETGDRQANVEILCNLADLYNTSIDYIVGRTDSR